MGGFLAWRLLVFGPADCAPEKGYEKRADRGRPRVGSNKQRKQLKTQAIYRSISFFGLTVEKGRSQPLGGNYT